MKDWQPTPSPAAVPVRGRLFCYLGSRVLMVKRFRCSRSGCLSFGGPPAELGFSSPIFYRYLPYGTTIVMPF